MSFIEINSRVDSIVMPENLRVGMMVVKYRRKCQNGGCSFDYTGFAFGQSPIHAPSPTTRALGEAAAEGHYAPRLLASMNCERPSLVSTPGTSM